MGKDLTEEYIDETYKGIVHLNGVEATTSRTQLSDGAGNNLSLHIGKDGAGIKVGGASELAAVTATTVTTTGNITSNTNVNTTNVNCATVNATTLKSTNLTLSGVSFNPLGVAGNLLYKKSATSVGTASVQSLIEDTVIEIVNNTIEENNDNEQISDVVKGNKYSTGDIRSFQFTESGKVKGIGISNVNYLNKDMGRTRVQAAPANITYDVLLLDSVWVPVTLTIDSGWDSDSGIHTPKAATLYIQRSGGNVGALSAVANIRSSLNPIINTGSGVTYDPNGHRVLMADIGVNRVGTQFFSSISAYSTDQIIVYLKDDGSSNSYWDVSLQAVHY